MKVLLIEDSSVFLQNILETLEGVAEMVFPPTFPPLPWDRKSWFRFPPKKEMMKFIQDSDADIVLLDINLGTTYTGWDLAIACKGKKVVCISLDERYPTRDSVPWTKKGDLYQSNTTVREEFIKFLQNL